MTTFEHILLGASGAMAAGLHRRSWELVAIAGAAAVLPDWDGLAILFGAAAFDHLHRAVGHSVIVATLVATGAAVLEHRFRLLARCGSLLGRIVSDLPTSANPSGRRPAPALCVFVAVVATWSHLAADLLFSGHAQLSDWGLKLLWPFSDRTFVYPAVRWGDPCPTIIFVAGMFGMFGWRNRLQVVAALTLASLVGYIAWRAFVLHHTPG